MMRVLIKELGTPIIISCLIGLALVYPIISGTNLISRHAGNSADRGYAGYKLATEGFLTHRFGHYSINGTYYTHHPPLSHIITGISFKIFGDSDFSNILPPLTFSLIGAFSFYLLAVEVMGRKKAVVALFFYTITPVYLYYSHINFHENYSVPILTTSVYFLLKTVKNEQIKLIALYLLLSFLGTLFSWHVWFFYPIGILSAILLKNRMIAKYIGLGFSLSTLGLIISVLVNNYTLGYNGFWELVSKALLFRTGWDGNAFSLFNNPVDVAVYLISNIITIINAWVLLSPFMFKRMYEEISQQARAVVISLALYPLIPTLLFSNAFVIHEYLFLYLLPAISLALTVLFWRFKTVGRSFMVATYTIWTFFILTTYYKPIYQKAHDMGVYIREKYPNATAIYCPGFLNPDYAESILAYYSRKNVLSKQDCATNKYCKYDLTVDKNYKVTVVRN